MKESITSGMQLEIDISAVVDAFVYMDQWSAEYSNLSLSEICEKLHNIQLNPEAQAKLSIIESAIASDTSGTIGGLKLINQSNVNTDIPSTELIACTFKDSDNNIYVSYRGTGDGKWVDNGEAMVQESSLMQRRAQEYFDYIADKETIEGKVIVTGHSKGGNSAQYVAMASEHRDLIDQCYSLDGQGFSREAIEAFKQSYIDKYGYEEGLRKYQDQINKMYSINGNNDYVHDLGIPIIDDDHTYFVQTTTGDGIAHWHEIDGMFFGNGKINWSTENGKIISVEQGPVGGFAKELSVKLMALDREDLEDCAISIMSLIELGEDYKFGTGERKFASPEEFIGFIATGVPIILSIDSKISAPAMKKIIGGFIYDYAQKIANGEKTIGDVAKLAFIAPFVVAAAVPLGIATWTCSYIAEQLFDIGDKLRMIKAKVSEFCRQMGETISQKLSELGDYISSKVSDFMSWITDGWKGKESSSSERGTSRANLILITPESLHRQAKTVRQYKSDQESCMGKLRRLIYSLDESWKGEAQDAFVAKFQSMESIYKKLSTVLEQYASLMDKAANEMYSTDQNIKRMIQNI